MSICVIWEDPITTHSQGIGGSVHLLIIENEKPLPYLAPLPSPAIVLSSVEVVFASKHVNIFDYQHLHVKEQKIKTVGVKHLTWFLILKWALINETLHCRFLRCRGPAYTGSNYQGPTLTSTWSNFTHTRSVFLVHGTHKHGVHPLFIQALRHLTNSDDHC